MTDSVSRVSQSLSESVTHSSLWVWALTSLTHSPLDIELILNVEFNFSWCCLRLEFEMVLHLATTYLVSLFFNWNLNRIKWIKSTWSWTWKSGDWTGEDCSNPQTRWLLVLVLELVSLTEWLTDSDRVTGCSSNLFIVNHSVVTHILTKFVNTCSWRLMKNLTDSWMSRPVWKCS